jgi:hypothetical protein
MADEIIEQKPAAYKDFNDYRSNSPRGVAEAPTNGELKDKPSEEPEKAEPKPVVAPEATEESTQETPEQKEAKRNAAFAELRTNAKKEKERADRLEKELQESRTRKPDSKPEEPKAAVQIDDPKPTMKQFLADAKDGETFADVTEKYTEAVADWRDRQRDKAAKEAEINTRQQTAKQAFETKLNSARAKHSDFDQVTAYDHATNQGLALSAPMRQFAIESEHGCEVIYELGKDQAEYQRIMALPLYKQMSALDKIEDRLSGSGESSEKPKIPVSKVPPPPSRVGGTEATKPKSSQEAAKDGYDSYRKHRLANERK